MLILSTQKIIFLVTHGEEFKDRLEPPLHLATLAALLEAEVKMIYTMSAGLLMKKGVPDKLKAIGKENTLLETIQEAKEAGVQIYVCSPVLDMYNLTREDLIDEVDDIVGGMYLVTESLEADVTYTF